MNISYFTNTNVAHNDCRGIWHCSEEICETSRYTDLGVNQVGIRLFDTTSKCSDDFSSAYHRQMEYPQFKAAMALAAISFIGWVILFIFTVVAFVRAYVA